MTRHVEREEQNPAVSGVTPMPRTLEVLAPGTMLEGAIRFTGATEIERSCIAYGLDRLEVLGGHAAAGLGAVAVTHDGDAAAYSAWLDETTDLTARLEAFSETLVSRAAPAKERSKT